MEQRLKLIDILDQPFLILKFSD